MKVVHLSAECYPVAKVGGLADVVGALPKYQKKQIDDACVVMPFYNTKFTSNSTNESLYKSTVKVGEKKYNYEVLKLKKPEVGFDLFLIDIPGLLFTEFVYSNDDTERFLAFQIATLDWILTWNKKPSVIHCHDHHTGLTPFMISQCTKYQDLSAIPTILTIHNAQYQGWFSHEKVDLIPEFDFKYVGLLDWNGVINPLAAAIKCSWKVTTVSPSYMEELKQNANGLELLLQHEAKKCSGILNGIDWEVWNPETDSYIVKNYKKSTVQSGRKANKKWICDTYNLDVNKPMFAFIGRLVGEKGSDIFPAAFKKALGTKDKTIFLLGSGHKEVENDLTELKSEYISSYNAYIGYDEKLSHIIYAGTDFLLMPSRVEPCGLNQMYALRYGAIPIVRSIGGLKDTVVDIDSENGFGICHDTVSEEEMVTAMNRAVELYSDQKKFKKIRRQIMNIDHSWDASAQSYIRLYKSLKN